MVNARDIERRIDSVKNVRQITRTMKAVASAKLNRAQTRIENARAYAQGIEKSIRDILARAPRIDHEYFQTTSGEKAGERTTDRLSSEQDTHPAYLALSGDRGLCGAYNSNIFDRTESLLETSAEPALYVVGKRGSRYFESHDVPVKEDWVNFWEHLEYEQTFAVTDRIVEDFLQTDITSVTIVYNEFESAMVQNVREYPLLPLNREDFYGYDRSDNEMDFLYEPDVETVVDRLFPRHVRTQVYTALLEAFAAVQGARMIAMDNATENASEMIDDLTLEYNQARQSSITREIADITGGAEALKES